MASGDDKPGMPPKLVQDDTQVTGSGEGDASSQSLNTSVEGDTGPKKSANANKSRVGGNYCHLVDMYNVFYGVQFNVC